MADFADAFLQTYMGAQAAQQQQKLAVQQFAWQNMWNNAKLAQEQQQEAARLQQQQQYQGALIKDTQDRQAVDAAKDQLAAQRQGAVVAKPQTDAVPLSGATAQPALSLPNELQRTGLSIPPEGAVNLGGMLLRQQSPQELSAQAQQETDRQTAAGQQRIDQMLKAGLVNPDAHRQLSALNSIHAALGNADASTVQSIIAPKAGAVREGDEPLSQQQIAQYNSGIKLRSPNHPELLLPPNATRNQFKDLETMVSGIENANASKDQRDIANSFRQSLLDMQKGREADRVATENEKQIGPARDAVVNTREYMMGGKFTGAGDEQLQERFFDAIKPSSGFRMSKQMMDLNLKLQSAENKARGWWANVTGGQLYSDQLRKDVADQIEAAYRMKAEGLQNKGKATIAPPAQPSAPTPAPAATRPPLSSFGH